MKIFRRLLHLLDLLNEFRLARFEFVPQFAEEVIWRCHLNLDWKRGKCVYEIGCQRLRSLPSSLPHEVVPCTSLWRGGFGHRFAANLEIHWGPLSEAQDLEREREDKKKQRTTLINLRNRRKNTTKQINQKTHLEIEAASPSIRRHFPPHLVPFLKWNVSYLKLGRIKEKKSDWLILL